MSDRRDFQLFDNYEEDGQLSLFSADYDDWDEDWTEDVAEGNEAAQTGKESVAKGVKSLESVDTKADAAQTAVLPATTENVGPDIRVKYCACCGKLLFVREETAGFRSECNNCGVKYFQKL